MSDFVSPHFPTVSMGLRSCWCPRKWYADSLPEAETFLPPAMVPLPSYSQNPLHSQIEMLHFPYHISCFIPPVSPEESVILCPICFELCTFASIVKASYYCHKENSSCSACGHLLRQDLNHLSLDCLASESLCKSVFSSAGFTLACGSTVGFLQCCFASPSLKRSWITPPHNQASSKIETMQYALQIIKNNHAIVPNAKKSVM